MINKRQLAVLSFLLLLFVPLAIAASYRQTTTWTMGDIISNSSNCTSVTQIGYGYSKALGTLSYTNSTGTDVGNSGSVYNLKVLLRYGDTSGVATNGSWTQDTSYDASALSAKYVGVCFNTSDVNASATTGVDVENIALTYMGGGAIDDDTLEGLPHIGSDVGSFLKNLAPGVGAFIIILGVFGAVAAIIYAIVGIVKRKVEV